MEVGSYVVLCGVFWFEVGVAYESVVEVVERWCSEYSLVEGSPYPWSMFVGCAEHG